MRFLNALSFLTVIRLPRRGETPPREVARSLGLFPLVGLVIGLILAVLYWLLNLVLPLAVVSGLVVAAAVVLSGGMHLDGLVDTCDGLAGGKSVASRWRAMRDSRAGAFGIIGVVLLILVKYVALSSIPPGLSLVALVVMPSLSRWAMVYAIYAYPYARPAGLGKVFKEEASRRRLAAATITALAVAVFWFYWTGLVVMGGVWVIVLIVAIYLKKRFAGLTGDTYGAINEVAEVAVLLLVSLLAYNNWLGLVWPGGW